MSAVKDRGTANREKRMSLGAHLVELRKRLFTSAIAIVLGAVVGWILTDLFIWNALQAPVEAVAEAQGGGGIIFPTISSAFDLRLQVAFTVGIVISSPVWLYQIFAFLVPGLNTRERKFSFIFLASAIPLFLAGCAAGWFVLPNIVKLMTGFVPEGSENVRLRFSFGASRPFARHNFQCWSSAPTIRLHSYEMRRDGGLREFCRNRTPSPREACRWRSSS